MKNDVEAIWILSIISIILAYLSYMFNINIVDNTLICTIIINVITGCFVSSVIAYIDYKNKFDETIAYFIKQIEIYYLSLSRIEKYIKDSKKDDNNLIESINGELSIINSNARSQREAIELFFLIPTINKIELYNTINKTYDITFGIALYSINLKAKTTKNVENSKLIKCYEKMVKEEKKIIKEKMNLMKKYNISKSWNYFLLNCKLLVK